VLGNSGKMEDDSINTTSEKYYYEMDKKQQKAFNEKLGSIKIGDSVHKVKMILGEPTYDQTLVSKEGEFRARVLQYCIKIWKKNLVNEKYDKSVWLIFDEEGKLIRIESNAEEMSAHKYINK
jgi:hypothetical protein